MSSSDKKRRRIAVNEYAIKTVSYLIIMLAVTVAAVFVLIKPVTELVHKVESYVPMESRDIVLDDSTYNLSADEKSDLIEYDYGAKIGVVTGDSFGLNSSIYCGANRMSMAKGVGFDKRSGLIGGDGMTVITGYMEGSFSSLEYAEEGNELDITTPYGKFRYRITDVQYSEKTESSLKDRDSALVLCGICSDFSQHSGEKLMVFADKADGEVH